MKNIAILLATYNGEKYLRQQLNSLFEQTNTDFRLVIHDDGSTDGTIDIINEYRDAHPDRIEILYGDSCGGPKENFLWMLAKVEADYYFLCDQDDVWLPNKVDKTLQALSECEYQAKENHTADNNPICVFTDMRVVDENLGTISDSFIRYIGRLPSNILYSQIIIDNPAAGCTMCFNRKLRDLVVDALPKMDLQNIPMHDVLILEIAAIMGKVVAVDEPLALYRQTGFNTMGAVTETESDKAERNLEDFKEGNIKSKKKAFVEESRRFAGELIKADWLPKDKKNILIRFANIGNKSKINRMVFYSKNHFLRAHHNLWFLMWV